MAGEGAEDFARCRTLYMPSGEIEAHGSRRQDVKPKTTFPKIAGSYKLPPSSLLHRPDEQQSVNESMRLEVVGAGFDGEVRGIRGPRQVTQINPGRLSPRSSSNRKPASNTAASLDSRTIFA